VMFADYLLRLVEQRAAARATGISVNQP